MGVAEEDLKPGTEYWAEIDDVCVTAQISLGAFKYRSGEGFLYFDNGSFLDGGSGCVTFRECEKLAAPPDENVW